MSIAFQSTTIPGYETQDETPDFPESGVIMCEKCHARPVAPYGGRGPRPKRCVECKGKSNGSPKIRGKNEQLAAQATKVLMQLNGFVAVGMALMQLRETALKWREETTLDRFEDSVYEALLLDPDLCAWLCRGGVKSGKIALIAAYLFAGAAVAPTMIAEIKEKQAERQEKKEQEEREATRIWTP